VVSTPDHDTPHRSAAERHTLERCAWSGTRRRAHISPPVSCDQAHVFGWYFGFREGITMGGLQSVSSLKR
jgi:hypothetical protein